MPNHVQNIITLKGDEQKIREMLKTIKNDDYGLGTVDFNKVIPMPESCDWYEWSISNWGTKWNAYGYEKDMDYSGCDSLRFQTAWSAPHPVLEKLTEIFPDIEFEHEWADEDIGENCGRYRYKDGERIEEYVPECEKDCIEFACRIWDCDPAELDLMLNKAENGYVNIEMDSYDLISLFGKPALFTNERLTDADIPKGLYCYDVRHNDNGSTFATVEPKVTVNLGGSVITDEPIDFGERGYISFTEETEPNFIGRELTIGEYMRGEFEQSETESQQNGGIQL